MCKILSEQYNSLIAQFENIREVDVEHIFVCKIINLNFEEEISHKKFVIETCYMCLKNLVYYFIVSKP